MNDYENNYNTKLLCTIVRKSELIDMVNLIREEFNIDRKKIFCLRGVNNNLNKSFRYDKDNELKYNDDFNWILTYNVIIDEDDIYRDYTYPLNLITRRIYRNGETNTIYTISALNLISEEEYGNDEDYDTNTKYAIKWNDYPDCFLFKKHDQLIKINTELETVFII